MRRVVSIVVLITAARAAAHVAPSVDDNNRYLKVTPQADRVRVAYTVFFGEVPGAKLRPTLDTNRDGTISEAEAQVFGDRVAADVRAALVVDLDGRPQQVSWKTVSVGLGSPAVQGGSFSVDMIAYLCLITRARGRHEVHILDRFRVPRPGETEVRVEDGLGIRVERARIGDASALGDDWKFVGPGGPLADDGLSIVYEASDRAPLGGDCAAADTPAAGRSYFRLGLILGGALALVLVVGLWIAASFRKARPAGHA